MIGRIPHLLLLVIIVSSCSVFAPQQPPEGGVKGTIEGQPFTAITMSLVVGREGISGLLLADRKIDLSAIIANRDEEVKLPVGTTVIGVKFGSTGAALPIAEEGDEKYAVASCWRVDSAGKNVPLKVKGGTFKVTNWKMKDDNLSFISGKIEIQFQHGSISGNFEASLPQ